MVSARVYLRSHVGGLAALVKQRFADKTPQQVVQYLKDQAQARGEVPNNDWGYGFAKLPASDAQAPTPTPEPTPEPTPADPCAEAVGDRTAISGSWDSSCVSERAAPNGGDRYARYYTFSLGAAASVSVELTSTEDTYLYLTGNGVEHENDDIVSGNANSRIEQDLAAGDYKIEATTYEAAATGDFTLAVDLGETPSHHATARAHATAYNARLRHRRLHRRPLRGLRVDSLRSAGATITPAPCARAAQLPVGAQMTMGQATPPSSGRFISVSSDHKGSCAVRDDGRVICWGSFVVNSE